MSEQGAELGRRLIEEMHQPTIGDEVPLGEVTELLRWGAGEVDDETLLAAALVAAERAADDFDRWQLGDGVVDESIATRHSLRARWAAARHTNPAVAEVYRVMCDPTHNWTHAPDSWWLDD